MLNNTTVTITTLVFLGLLVCASAWAALAVEPAYVELSLDSGRPSDVITVRNVTDQEIRYRAEVVHFVYGPEGSVQMVEPDEHSLATWTKFNPREFTLAGKESRAVRLTIIPPKDLVDGEYWAALWFQPLKGFVSKGEATDGRSMALEVKANILVPIIGHTGELKYECELKDLKAWKDEGGVSLVANLINTGNGRARVKGGYEILDPDGNVVGDGVFGEGTLLAAGERLFTRHVEGEFGEGHTVRVTYTSEKLDDVLAGQTRVRAEAPAEYTGGE